MEFYGLIEQELNIDQETFDRIISDEGARGMICECLLYCLESIPELEEVAAIALQYIVDFEANEDGGPGSGNWGHEGRPGEVGGSLISGKTLNGRVSAAYKKGDYTEVEKAIRTSLKEMPIGSSVLIKGVKYTKTGEGEFEYVLHDSKHEVNDNQVVNSTDLFNSENAPQFEEPSSEEVAEQLVKNGELDPNGSDMPAARLAAIREVPAGRAIVDSNGDVWTLHGDDEYVSSATGEIISGTDLADAGGVPAEYTGRLEFNEGDVDAEAAQRAYSEALKNQALQDGKATLTSERFEEMLTAVKAYNYGEQCKMILCYQTPERYQGLPSSFMEEAHSSEVKKWSDDLDAFLEIGGRVDEPVYRGVGYVEGYHDERIEALKSLMPGDSISYGHISSWSSNRGTARAYSQNIIDAVDSGIFEGTCYCVTYEVASPKKTVDARGLMPEGECLSPRTASYTVKNVSHSYDEELDAHYYHVQLEEDD